MKLAIWHEDQVALIVEPRGEPEAGVHRVFHSSLQQGTRCPAQWVSLRRQTDQQTRCSGRRQKQSRCLQQQHAHAQRC